MPSKADQFKRKETKETVEEAPVNATDAAAQERILHPDPHDVVLSYGAVRLHPLAIAPQREAFGFCSRLMKNVSQDMGAFDGSGKWNMEFSMEIGALLNENPDETRRLLRHIAGAMGKPGEIRAESRDALADEIFEKADAPDIVRLFNALIKLSGYFSRSKNA